jgi:leucyl aminopeptidase (aminopeptidase T)
MKSREINGEEPPESIAEMMKSVDVVICPTTKSITHTNARRNAAKLGVRVATMPGITLDTMVRCLSADADKIIELSNKIVERMKNVEIVRVVTEIGTDLVMPMKGRNVISSTGVLRSIGESGNLPSGEVYLAPLENKSNGKVVFDGSVAGIGLLSDPIVVTIKDGYAVNIDGKNDARRLSEMLLKVNNKDAYAVAEFGIGTNYKAQLCGDILEDEKVLGTIHVAFGNNISMGGNIAVNSHIDGLVKKPDVYFDDALVMSKGKLLI